MTAAPSPGQVADLVERFQLAVFPLPPGGRRPLAPGWQDACMADPEHVRRAWPPGHNVGVGCRASGVVGLDLDVREANGIERFAAMCEAHGVQWPATLSVRTASGGLHVYGRLPAGRTVVTRPGESPLGPGIDVRSPGRRFGGYLIGPGSVVDGVTYTVECWEQIQVLPAFLVEQLADPLD
jgi:hypothetical protein